MVGRGESVFNTIRACASGVAVLPLPHATRKKSAAVMAALLRCFTPFNVVPSALSSA
jgi:hypothetical protein